MAKWYTRVDNWGSGDDGVTFSQAFALVLVCTDTHEHQSAYDRPSQVTSEYGTSSFTPTWNNKIRPGDTKVQGSATHYFNKTKDDRDVTLTGFIYRTNTGANSTGYLTVNVPRRRYGTVTYKWKRPSDTEYTVFGQFNKYYGWNENLTSRVPEAAGYKFVKWTYNGRDYYPNDLFTANPSTWNNDGGNIDLIAVMASTDPPSCDETHTYINVDDSTPTPKPYTQVIKNFSNLKVDISGIALNNEERTKATVTLSIGDVTDTATATRENISSLNKTYSVKPTQSGNFQLKVKVQDYIGDTAAASTEFVVADVTVVNPTWLFSPTFNVSDVLVPDTDTSGNAVLTLQAEKYVSGTATGTYEDLTGSYSITTFTENNVDKWSVDAVIGEDYVSNILSVEPTANFKIKSATHTETSEKDYSKAFYNTTRNANYSNGIYNNIFVGGCDAFVAPDYTSRVWWSQINNPLYFPDTNYVEVGSNDTSIQGLCKVGDYLGAVKQSKTTDTAIYLLYPTSFDEETTFAVKQGVQGVGALGKYTFNVLGDETLFLSPNGVVAITPSEDEEHKVQNRSYFVDGKLLKEYSADSGYSFVLDGKYWLAIGTKMYVLDGNQKNSYGNDKTNLVYEAYYLDNVPANCLIKYNDELWFSNADNLCRFKNSRDVNKYIDGYDVQTEESNVPVKAEWSTILDDDGSLHYLKTMQKKGNVVSILPIDGEQTSAKVYIKKDSEEPIYVGEINGEVEEEDIPNELHIKKKIKKYKRLGFIIKNEKNEGMGVDSITKSYYLGNYAKR